MSPSVTTNSNTVPLEFENNIVVSHKTFGNKRVIYFIALHLDGISGIVHKCKLRQR